MTEQSADEFRFSNKLVPDKGLALSVYDVWTAEDGKVTWGNGMMYYKGSFSCFPHHQPELMGSIIQIDAIRPLYWRSYYRQNYINE
jgi:DNA-directed RNA polymerase subunit E'/Rpb7